MDSFRRSFKSHGSQKYTSSRIPSIDQEDEPILFTEMPLNTPTSPNTDEVVVKIDGNSQPHLSSTNNNNNNNNSYRKGGATASRTESYEFWSQHIGSNRHKNNLSDIRNDSPTDLEVEEDFKKLPTSTNGSKELRVSFQSQFHNNSPSSDDDDNSGHRNSPASSRNNAGISLADEAEVLRCTSSVSSRLGASALLRAKTRSRLMDPIPPPSTADEAKKSDRVPKSGQLKSGMLGKSQRFADDEDEDPFLDEDIPDEFKRQSSLNWLYLLQWLSLLLISAFLICTLAIPWLKAQMLWQLNLWKWALMVFVIVCGGLVSGWVIRLVVFCIERNFFLRKRLLYFVYSVRKPVQNCLWLGFVLLTWHFLFDKKVQRGANTKPLRYVTKVLFCLLVANLIRLVKTFLVKVLASSFHVNTYFDRIQESLFNQYVIETLSGPPMIGILNTREEEDRMMAEVQRLQNAGARVPNELRAAAFPSKSIRVIGAGNNSNIIGKSGQIGKSMKLTNAVSRKEKQADGGIKVDHLMKLNQKNVSAWKMKRLVRMVRHGALSTLDEKAAQESAEDDYAREIRSEYEAKTAAKKIFQNVTRPNAKYIYFEDLTRFMREDEALKTMSLFEGAQDNNRISKKALKNWVVNAFKERRALSLTLTDAKTAVNKLHQMANVVVFVIVFGLWLLILGIATTSFFVYLSSQALLSVFMFGNTMKMIFEAIIFLFVMHPYDVGDRCEIEGVQMFVEEMNILTTVFLRYDNQKVTYPNSVLATLPIGNFYRSPDMGESIDFSVHVATPVEKIAQMRERIIGYMESKKEHWYPNPSVVLRDVDDMNRLKVSIWMRHRINFQDMGIRWARRELVVQEMIKVCKELEIEYRMLPIDVNVRKIPDVNSSRLPSTWSNFNA